MRERAKRGVLEPNVGGSFKYLHKTTNIILLWSVISELKDDHNFLNE